MATFALGLTKSAVAGTVSTVKAAIEEETNLRLRVQDDLVFITGEFEMMQAFLSASGTGERSSKNLVVRTWVRQLRDLAFDVEDCVEFVVHLDKGSRWEWVRRLTSSVRVCVGKPPLPLDVAVADIKRLKARVEDIGERNTRYNLFPNVDGGADDNSDQQMLTHTRAGSASSTTFQVLRKVWKDKKKLHEASSPTDLKKLIGCEGSELQVISLWGSPQADDTGPLGWKAVLKQAYDDPDTCRVFKKRAWVKPTHPFNPVEFLNTLLNHFTSHLEPPRRHHDDMSELVRQVSQHKYLIVLEQELSSIADWDTIKLFLPDGNMGSRIVVCTRHLGIALACTREPYEVWELRPFSRDQFFYAFFREGRGHRIGMAELSWHLRHPGVLSVYCNYNSNERKKLMSLLFDDDSDFRVDGMEFARCCVYDATWDRHQTADVEEGGMMIYSSDPSIKWSRIKLVATEEDYELRSEEDYELGSEEDYEPGSVAPVGFVPGPSSIVCIMNMKYTMYWDRIRDRLLESTRGCILVITQDPRMAKCCEEDHETRALNAKDLLRGHRGHGDQESNTDEEDEPVGLAGCDYNEIWLTAQATYAFWGIAGVGKSALVRNKYDSLKCDLEDYHTVGWVDVPRPFNLEDLCRRLLLDFSSDEAKEAVAIAMMEGQDPTQWCSKVLHEGKFLIVFDGLQAKDDWDLIKATLLTEPISGTTVVITREESIATHCAESPHLVHNIKGLKADAALDLFTAIAFDDNERPSSPHESEMLNLIVSKCGGLPEIITALGRVNKNLEYKFNWEGVNAEFIGVLESIEGLRGLFFWMQTYFDGCSDELKPCIFYLSAFPADQSIRTRRLLRRWIAEGYASGGCGGGAAAEEKVEELLQDLLKLSILYNGQETSTIKGCKVNGFFSEYIKSRPMGDNLVFTLEGSCSPSSRLTGQHLTISSSWDRDVTVFTSIDLSRLRSLTVFGEWKSFLTSEKMKRLRVLDLEGTDTSYSTCVTDDDLKVISKLLRRLKFLSLRGCKQITRLPDTLGDMRQLQTLDVRYTSIVELRPAIITKLHKLQYIRAGTSTDTSLLLLETKTSTLTAPPPSPSSPPTPPLSPPPTQPPSPPPPQEDSHGGTSPVSGATGMTEAWKRKARISCWKLKNQTDLHRRHHIAANGGGVEVCLAAAKGVGMLTDMHTLGVVNVAGGKCALFFLKEVKKLTQLRKLGLSGINRQNWKQLCQTISGNLHHLESMSLQLMLLKEDGGSFDFACLDNIRHPPKTLKNLKVLYTKGAYRGASISPAWLKKLPNLLRRIDREVRISRQDDISEMDKQVLDCVLFIKPIKEDLNFDKKDQHRSSDLSFSFASLKIECSGTLTPLKVTFGRWVFILVKEISIHCCCSSPSGTTSPGSSSCNLQIAELNLVIGLEEVTVTGTYADGLKQDLRDQVDNHPRKPVLK